MNTKLSLLLLISIACSVPLSAQYWGPHPALSRRANPSISSTVKKGLFQQEQKKNVDRKEGIRNKLLQETLKKEFTLTFEDSMLLNEVFSEYIQNKWNLLSQQNRILENNPSLQQATQKNFRAKEGEVNYAEITKGYKYIFIGEYHHLDSLHQEESLILAQIRKANPQAKILFATEELALVSEKAPIFFSQEEQWPALHMEPLVDSGAYQSALREQMDLLPLAEFLPSQAPDGSAVLKMGTMNISYPYTLREALSEHDKLASTFLGMTKRNDLWIRYIKAIAPYYDIIIVHAGNLHFQRGGIALLSLPESFPAEQSLSIFLQTKEALQGTESLKETADAFYGNFSHLGPTFFKKLIKKSLSKKPSKKYWFYQAINPADFLSEQKKRHYAQNLEQLQKLSSSHNQQGHSALTVMVP